MTVQLDLLAPADGEMRALRKLLSSLHSELRDRGLSPMEAAEATALGLAGGEVPRLDGTSFQTLESLAADSQDPGPLLALLYQEFLVSEARSGLGQYLTPLPVADLITEVLKDRVPSSPLVVDPFCGAGILLDRFAIARPDASLAGLEISVGVASMAQALAQVAKRDLSVHLVDSFESWAAGDLPKADVVLTNPPFGSIASTINTQGHKRALPPSLKAMKRVPAELLGLEVSTDALVPGGWLAAVLPQSVLTNSSWSPYRHHLFSRLQLTGVVSLPEETFAPYRGVAKACVVFARKRAQNSDGGSSPVPFYRSGSVGYDDTGRAAETPSDMKDAVDCMRGVRSPEWTIETNADGGVHIPPSVEAEVGSFVRLGDIAHVFCGRTPPRSEYVDAGPFLLKVGNLKGSFISWSDRKRSHISQARFDKTPRLHLRPGDICMTSAAHRPRYVGKKVDVVYEIPEGGAMPSAEVLVIRLASDAPIEPEELLFHLRSALGYQQIQDLVRGSTAHLYPKDVSELPIPVSAAGKCNAVALFREAARMHLAAVEAERRALEAAGLDPDNADDEQA